MNIGTSFNMFLGLIFYLIKKSPIFICTNVYYEIIS